MSDHAGIDHGFHGIRGIDRPTPPLWWIGFLASIGFSLVYVAYWHGNPDAMSAEQQWEKDQVADFTRTFGTLGELKPDEPTVLRMMADRKTMEVAKGIFVTNCAQCHGRDAAGTGGSACPNLTDNSWKNVKVLGDVLNVITAGANNGAMPAWGNRLSQNERIIVSAYVASLRASILCLGVPLKALRFLPGPRQLARRPSRMALGMQTAQQSAAHDLQASRPSPAIGPWVVAGLIAAATVACLRFEGRRWWCVIGDLRIWSGDVWSSHCSQHVFDPYSITHMSHGLIFYWVLRVVAPRMQQSWRFCIAIAIAAAWEILENSPLVIDRYRSVTMSLDYLGDSVINSLGDVASCALGFVVARWLGWRWTLALFVSTELLLLALIRDNLTLNVIMLIRPVEAIKHWQSVGHAAGWIVGL